MDRADVDRVLEAIDGVVGRDYEVSVDAMQWAPSRPVLARRDLLILDDPVPRAALRTLTQALVAAGEALNRFSAVLAAWGERLNGLAARPPRPSTRDHLPPGSPAAPTRFDQATGLFTAYHEPCLRGPPDTRGHAVPHVTRPGRR